jgi:formamidopyrimidine-DNA glycosylase
MPELPEVETITRRLKKGDNETSSVIGQTIQSVEVTWKRIIAQPGPEEFKEILVGKTITGAQRRGKFLHFTLNEGHLFGHLRMSGDVRMEKRVNSVGEAIPKEEYDKVIFNFEGVYRMVFSNIRKFGRMWYTKDPKIILDKLGPEPLSDDFTSQKLHEMLHDRSRQLKPLLMDQTFIAGLGNLYTNEALYQSKIHPLRQSDSLSLEETKRLHKGIRFVLQRGIDRMGASIDWIYKGGKFQEDFSVYGKEGEPCPRCGTTIEKILAGQRATYFCPECQVMES